ncbi:hypothetical protein, partial [Variovorax sp. 22077]|uniref:hypothetical protein n=1 Tax=Variovorax sp. 22077 TaxID=3453867 RepID=UPI003F82B565
LMDSMVMTAAQRGGIFMVKGARKARTGRPDDPGARRHLQRLHLRHRSAAPWARRAERKAR